MVSVGRNPPFRVQNSGRQNPPTLTKAQRGLRVDFDRRPLMRPETTEDGPKGHPTDLTFFRPP